MCYNVDTINSNFAEKENVVERSQLNEIYKKLDEKAKDISKLFHCDFSYFNGHYYKTQSGEYEMDYFPIPVVSLKGVCDIEIALNQISVTTKLTRETAISYDFEKVKSYSFEAYGANNYLDDFYIVGDTINNMVEKIKSSRETHIFFSFYFPFEVATSIVCEFVKLIRNDGFFY